jgi:hypothetical protein
VQVAPGGRPAHASGGLLHRGLEFTGESIGSRRVGGIAGHEVGTFESGQKVLAVREPLDLDIHRRGDRVEEVEANRIGNESRFWASLDGSGFTRALSLRDRLDHLRKNERDDSCGAPRVDHQA